MTIGVQRPEQAMLSAILPQPLPQSLASQLLALDVPLTGIKSDSRKVTAGDLFLARPGLTVDGCDFIDQAIDQGAAAVLVEPQARWQSAQLYRDVPVVPLAQLASQMGGIAARFYQCPSDSMTLIGVTGTNGKTSCSHYISALLDRLGQNSALVGTLGWGVPEAQSSLTATQFTTPDAIELQAILASLYEQAMSHVVMEVSSHGLDQDRVNGVVFDVALFTNLSHDHLDYHVSMQEYGAAKRKLFEGPALQRAIINIDDEFGRELVTQLRQDIQCVTYSLEDPQADVFVCAARFHSEGVDATLQTPWGQADVSSKLIGKFNLSNVLASVSVLCSMGFELAEVAGLVGELNAVPGRMEMLQNDVGINVVIDYAHTPDALENALDAVREHCDGELWCVFGCGGNRDTSKRPVMGAIAAKLSDHLVVTSDNPRNEEPQAIIDEIRVGCGDIDALVLEPRRDAAIHYAIQNAACGDSVLVAGKGHEDYQEIMGERYPFSDKEEATGSLQARLAQSQ